MTSTKHSKRTQYACLVNSVSTNIRRVGVVGDVSNDTNTNLPYIASLFYKRWSCYESKKPCSYDAMDRLYRSGGAGKEMLVRNRSKKANSAFFSAIQSRQLSVQHLGGDQVAQFGSIARNEIHHIALSLC